MLVRKSNEIQNSALSAAGTVLRALFTHFVWAGITANGAELQSQKIWESSANLLTELQPDFQQRVTNGFV